MYFESLVATAFGPFRDRRFEFAPGFNVLHGPNETGKSSLHAALWLGLCGMRRGRGRPGADLELEKRHRPWDGTDWRLGLCLWLADGRRVEITQDLDGKVESRAIDLDLGRDLTGEILLEGSPDGSKWLGLDRRAFLFTAAVRQAELLRVLDHPESLREHLQRAADTSGADVTAAAALARIEAFQREFVGQNRANSTKPLRRARERFEAAKEDLERAQQEHAEFLRLGEREAQIAVVETAEPPEIGPPPALLEAEAAYRAAQHAVQDHVRSRPPEVAAPDTGDATPEDLIRLAERLERSEPRTDSGLAARRCQLEAQRKRFATQRGLGIAAGGALLALGAVLLVRGDRVGGPAVALLGIVLAWYAGRSGRLAAILQQLGECTAAQRQERERHVAWQQDRVEAQARVAEWGVDAEPALLRQAAVQWQRAREFHRRLEIWEREHGERQRLRADRARILRDSLAALEVESSGDLEADLVSYRRACARRVEVSRRAESELVRLRTEMRLRGERLRSVAGAEEEFHAAAQEIERVTRLDSTLQRTREFLAHAQERVHRDIAPVLAASLERRLGEVTGGRYVEAVVDPESLEVRVRGGDGTWREAARLSHGTAEQIYLLLRVALAEHLTRHGESSPLLLDDATVQFDAERELAMLGALQVVSRERQVILLTQEDAIRDWAREHLVEPRDRFQQLGRLS